MASKYYKLFKETLRRIEGVHKEADGSIRVDFSPDRMKPPPLSKLGVTLKRGNESVSYSLTKDGCFSFVGTMQMAIKLINLPFPPKSVEFYVFKGEHPAPKKDRVMYRPFCL